MGRPKKTYLDLFLDNTEGVKKKREQYFTEVEEKEILRYNDPTTSELERTKIYKNVIESTFRKTVLGVLEMKKFHHLPRSMNREQLIEDTFYRLIEKIDKFTPGMVGKNGTPTKAFSYYSTVAKNFILEKKLRHEKILENRADVETSIDLSILSEDTLKKMSNYDRTDVQDDDYEVTLNNTKDLIIQTIEEILVFEESKKKKDGDFIKIGYVLVYLLNKWNKIEFVKKNEFMRILTLYTGFKQQQVSFHFKKYKVAVFKKLRPFHKAKKKKEDETIFDISEDELIVIDTNLDQEIDIDIIDIEEDPLAEDDESGEEEEEVKRFRYGVNSLEEFEQLLEFKENDKIKQGRIKTTPSVDI